MIEFEQEEHIKTVATIKVIGVGGGGGNTVNSIADAGVEKVELIAANTDAQALELSKAFHKVQLGVKSTKGLGTGSNPEVGRRAAEEDLDKIMEVVKDADIVFLTAGMGGGTGSGALPVIAQALKERGVLTLAVVTKPFSFEGKKRAEIAQSALEKVKKSVDTLIVVPNQRLLEIADKNISMIDAFSMINEVLSQSVKGISDIITHPGHINVDFADLKTIMQLRGYAVIGSASASGDNRATEAALKAITSPLLEEVSIEGARGVLLNITGGPDLGLHEISEAASVIQEQVHDQAHIILGSVIDETMNQDEVLVTLIATGFDSSESDESENEPIHITPAQSSVQHDSQEPQGHSLVSSSKISRPTETSNLDIPTFLREK